MTFIVTGFCKQELPERKFPGLFRGELGLARETREDEVLAPAPTFLTRPTWRHRSSRPVVASDRLGVDLFDPGDAVGCAGAEKTPRTRQSSVERGWWKLVIRASTPRKVNGG